MSVVRTVKIVGLGALALTLSVEWFGWLLQRFRSWRGPRGPLNEVLFFPSALACTAHVTSAQSQHTCPCPLPHGLETSFCRLLRHVLSASSSLDLCVFAFSNMDLSGAVLQLHSRGLTIRVLTDKDYSIISGSQIGLLRKAGICVRCDLSTVHMHHKFAVLDGCRLITGSLNWTLNAVQNNRENILVTEEPHLVQPFVEEFQRLWDINDPATHYAPASLSPDPSDLIIQEQ